MKAFVEKRRPEFPGVRRAGPDRDVRVRAHADVRRMRLSVIVDGRRRSSAATAGQAMGAGSAASSVVRGHTGAEVGEHRVVKPFSTASRAVARTQ